LNPKPSPIGKKYDWFYLVCAIFNEEYKANPKIQAAAQKLLLLDISEKLNNFGTLNQTSIDELTKQISGFADELKYLRQGIDKANESLESLHEKVDKLNPNNQQPIQFNSYLPPNMDDEVYGRDKEIDELIRFLRDEKGHAIISALTCLGKTSLIRKFLFRHYDQEENVSKLPDLFTDVLYLDCQQISTFESILRHFDAFLQTISFYDDSDKAEFLRLNILAKISEHKVLLIFDNFEAWQTDGKYLNADIAVFLNIFIANAGNMRAIFLSWFSPNKEKEFLAKVKYLSSIEKSLENGLEPEKAIELVRNESMQYCQNDSLVDLDKVSEADLHKFFTEVYYIPQAIQSMVHFIGNQQCTFGQFLDNYKNAFAIEERSEENLKSIKDKKLRPTNALIKMQISLLNAQAKYLLSHIAFYGIDVPQDILVLDLENTSAELSENRQQLNNLAKDRLVIRTIERRDQEPFELYHLHNFVYDAVIEHLPLFQNKYETHLENLANQMNGKTRNVWENKHFNKMLALVECWEKIEDYFVYTKKRTDRQIKRDLVDFNKALATQEIAEANTKYLTNEQINQLRANAEKNYQDYLKKNPNDSNAYNNLGILLANDESRWSEAESAYNKALEINPNDAEAYNNLGVLLANDESRWSEAESAFNKALEINPNDAEAYYNLGVLLANDESRWSEAESAFNKALEINPNDAEAYFNLACLRSISKKEENKDEALEYLRKAVELDSKYKAKAKTDPDFDFIRDDPRFKEIVGDDD
jgi:Flp pilus assembly protein TadD